MSLFRQGGGFGGASGGLGGAGGLGGLGGGGGAAGSLNPQQSGELLQVTMTIDRFKQIQQLPQPVKKELERIK
jgi:hypothetical protein